MKKLFSIKTLLVLLSAVCLGVGFGNVNRAEAKAEESSNISAKIERVETLNGGANLLFHFQYEEGYTTDYMTTAWEAGNNETYHWYLKDGFGMAEEDKEKFDSLGGQLAYEDKDKYNMPNALLDKNLDAYNFAEYILIDGEPLGNYEYVLYANRFTYVHTLSIELVGDLSPIVTATDLQIKAGCTLPSLTYSYFGEGEVSALVIEEEQLFKAKNGAWVKTYSFDGYEAGVTYDASEQFFYTRPHGSTLKGHPEAVAYEYTDVFSRNGWAGDEGFAVATTAETYKGSITVFDLVQPIDASQFGIIDLYVFSNSPRTVALHNAYSVTELSLGKAIDNFVLAPQTFNKVTIFSALYADENGMIDQFVFEFTNDGDEDETQNQFFLGSFTVRENNVSTVLYDKSLSWVETDTEYNITLRFNKQGEFNDALAVDESKILINGVSIADINAKGAYVTAKWASIAGIYQLDITLDKSYTGAGQFFNADLEYAGNKVSALEGLTFPNGDVLECSYTCNIYAGEILVDREFVKSYVETAVTSVTLNMLEEEADNLKFRVVFDKNLCSQEYVHACDPEAWREGALDHIGYYNKELTEVFIAGGFKSSLMDHILINGKTLGELHAIDDYNTCVFVHCGQMFQQEVLNVSVDSNSEIYQWLLPLFESGNGITLEIKAGIKFPNGVKTTADYKYTLKDGVFARESQEVVSLFFNGKAVENGATLKINGEASESSLAVVGTSDYKVTKSLEGNVVTFVVEFGGNKIQFYVEQNVADMKPIDKQVTTQEEPSGLFGCGSVVSGGLVGGMTLIALGATALLRRKRDEENQ